MLSWAFLFLIIAIVAEICGFSPDLPAAVSERLALTRAPNSFRKVQTPDGAFGAEKQPKPPLTSRHSNLSSILNEYRLEAYATLLFGASSDSSRSCGKTVTADPPKRRDGVK